jgi:hypothetical protein
VEHGAREVAIHSEARCAGAGNDDTLIDYAGQTNGSSHCEVNRIPVVRIGERLTK